MLVSSATRELVEDDLGDGISLVDLGTARLKDFDRPERQYAPAKAHDRKVAVRDLASQPSLGDLEPT